MCVFDSARHQLERLAWPVASVVVEFDAEEEAGALGAFEAAPESGCATDGVMSQSEAQANALWALRDGISESIAGFTPYKNDLAVRVSAMPAFLKEVDHIIGSSYPAFEVCWFGHIGDGNLHLNILKPEGLALAAFQTQCKDLSPRLFKAVQRHQAASPPNTELGSPSETSCVSRAAPGKSS